MSETVRLCSRCRGSGKEPNWRALGVEIRRREAMGMGLRELARRAGCSPGFVHNLERGRRGGGLSGRATRAVLRIVGLEEELAGRRARAEQSAWKRVGDEPPSDGPDREVGGFVQRSPLDTIDGALERERQGQFNAVYTERNRVVAALARAAIMLGGAVGPAKDLEQPDWPVVLIDLPGCGQVSWNVPKGEASTLFPWLGPDPGCWDGHDTDEKYERVDTFARQMVTMAVGDLP